MEYRLLGASGLEVSVLSMGTMTMGGEGRFAAMGNVQVEEARRQVEVCIEAGVNVFDTADIYSFGNEHPYRIELFDTEVDSIRIFNPETQLSERSETSGRTSVHDCSTSSPSTTYPGVLGSRKRPSIGTGLTGPRSLSTPALA